MSFKAQMLHFNVCQGTSYHLNSVYFLNLWAVLGQEFLKYFLNLGTCVFM